MSQYYSFCCILDQINSVSQRDFFKNIKKIIGRYKKKMRLSVDYLIFLPLSANI